MDMKEIQRLVDFILNPPLTAPRSTLIMRLMAGGVFLSEGILKFVYTNQGVGRFTKLGIPFPRAHGHLHRQPGDRRRDPSHRRPLHARHRDPVHHRDGGRDPHDQDLALPRDVSAPAPAGTAHGGLLGGDARDALRLRPDPHLDLPAGRGPRALVARRPPAPPPGRPDGLRSGPRRCTLSLPSTWLARGETWASTRLRKRSTSACP